MQTPAPRREALLLLPALPLMLLGLDLAALTGFLAAHALALAYLAGIVLHWLLKASAVAATPAAPHVPTRCVWLRRNWRALLIRFAITTALFDAWCADPGLVKDWLGLSLSPGSAFIFGYVWDGVLYLAAAKYRWLDGRIPGYSDDPPLPVVPPVQAAMDKVDRALEKLGAAQGAAVAAADLAAKTEADTRAQGKTAGKAEGNE